MTVRQSGQLRPPAWLRRMRHDRQKICRQGSVWWGRWSRSMQMEHSKSTSGWIEVTSIILKNWPNFSKVSSQRPSFSFSSMWFAMFSVSIFLRFQLSVYRFWEKLTSFVLTENRCANLNLIFWTHCFDGKIKMIIATSCVISITGNGNAPVFFSAHIRNSHWFCPWIRRKLTTYFKYRITKKEQS